MKFIAQIKNKISSGRIKIMGATALATFLLVGAYYISAGIVTAQTPYPGNNYADADIIDNGPSLDIDVDPGYLTSSYHIDQCADVPCGITESHHAWAPNFVVMVWDDGVSGIDSSQSGFSSTPSYMANLPMANPPTVRTSGGIFIEDYFATNHTVTIPYSPGQLVQVAWYQNVRDEYCGYFGCSGGQMETRWGILDSFARNSSGTLTATAHAELAVFDTPDVNFQINGSSSATIATGQSANLTWVPTKTQSGTACTATATPANGSWSGGKASTPGITYTQSTGVIAVAGNYSYSLQCNGGAGSVTTVKTVTLRVDNNVPTATITANGTPGSITIPYNTSATIAWESTNADSCEIAGEAKWGGTSGSENSGNLTTTKVYALSCTGPGGTATASVTVNVSPQQDFSVVCAPPTQTIHVGDTASFNLTTTPLNGFNSPVNFTADITPSKGAPTVDFVNNDAVPSAVTTAIVTTSLGTSPGTYTILFTGTGGGMTHDCPGGVILQIDGGAAATATITANGAQDSISIPYDTSAMIDWSSENTTNCAITDEPKWTGTSGSESTGNLTQTRTYTVVCTGGYATDSVTVNIAPKPPRTIAVDVISACEQAVVSWTSSQTSGITGYKVYRSTDGTVWQQIYSGGPSSFSHTDNPPLGSYYYGVTALVGSAESTKKQTGPVTVHACEPNLSNSDKDIVSVSPVGINTKSTNIQPCNAQSDPVVLNGNKSFKVDDIVTFQINICNTGDEAAEGVTVVDTLSNLSEPGNFGFDGCSQQDVLNKGSLIFTVGDVPAHTTCSISFTAKVTKPASGTIYRFQNIGDITPTNWPVKRVVTPAYLFTDSTGNPDRNEIAP